MVVRTVDEAFSPPGESWVRVSSRLAWAYRVWLGGGVLLAAVVTAVVAVLLVVPAAVLAAVAGACVVGAVWGWWVIGRRVRSWGYAEREDDLVVTRGILVRRLVIVPYGRMQLVDLKAGPLHRLLGITTVQLHTAAATTDASIPGLTPDVAADLRDRLARRGEQRPAGL